MNPRIAKGEVSPPARQLDFSTAPDRPLTRTERLRATDAQASGAFGTMVATASAYQVIAPFIWADRPLSSTSHAEAIAFITAVAAGGAVAAFHRAKKIASDRGEGFELVQFGARMASAAAAMWLGVAANELFHDPTATVWWGAVAIGTGLSALSLYVGQHTRSLQR